MFAALPIAVWEFTLGAWLVGKGFRPLPAARAELAGARADATRDRADEVRTEFREFFPTATTPGQHSVDSSSDNHMRRG